VLIHCGFLVDVKALVGAIRGCQHIGKATSAADSGM